MATINRADLIAKTFKVLKKKYKSTSPDGTLLLLDQLLFASCLENSNSDAALRAFKNLRESFFDNNEVRVSSIGELAEFMRDLADPRGAAERLRRILQSVFEANYSFDLEYLKKKTLGQATKDLQKFKGVTPFAISIVTQLSLSGHSIPTDEAALQTLYAIGIITEKEAKSGRAPGLERAIQKKKGIEFGLLLHQLAVTYLAKPFNSDVRATILSIAPDAKERFPKRKPTTKKKEVAPAKEISKAASEQKTTKKSAASVKKTSTKKTTGSAAAKSKKTAKKTTARKSDPKKKTKTTVRKKSTTKKTAKKKSTKSTARKTTARKATTSRGLAKKKPR